ANQLSKAWTWEDVHSGRRTKNQAEKDARRNFCYEHKLCFYCCSSEHDRDTCPKLRDFKERMKKEKKASACSAEVKEELAGNA
ncbi:hypothetical protein HYALB_00009299, partial [Hymenoscyphus albidus]